MCLLCKVSLTNESACSGILLYPDSRRWVAAAWVLQVERQSQLCVSAVACICAVPDFSICSHRSFLPPRPAATMGRTSSSLRYPQVLCVISQYPWFSFYYKILQVTEQLLKQDNVLNTYSKQQLAQNHPAGLFLTDLCHQCPQAPLPGKIIRSVTVNRRPPACQQHTQPMQWGQCTPCCCTAVCLQGQQRKYGAQGAIPQARFPLEHQSTKADRLDGRCRPAAHQVRLASACTLSPYADISAKGQTHSLLHCHMMLNCVATQVAIHLTHNHVIKQRMN